MATFESLVQFLVQITFVTQSYLLLFNFRVFHASLAVLLCYYYIVITSVIVLYFIQLRLKRKMNKIEPNLKENFTLLLYWVANIRHGHSLFTSSQSFCDFICLLSSASNSFAFNVYLIVFGLVCVSSSLFILPDAFLSKLTQFQVTHVLVNLFFQCCI